MKNHLYLSAFLISVVSVLLGACELPVTHRYRIGYNFIEPAHMVYMLGTTINFDVQVLVPFPPGYRPYYGPGGLPILNAVVFFANATEIGRATIISADSIGTLGDDTTAALFEAWGTWTPPSHGVYYIQAQSILMLGGPVNGDYSNSIQICVIADVSETRMCATDGITPIPFSAPFTFFTPTPTSTLIPIPTETPQGLCPPGTYYSSTTNQCIPVQIKPTRSGGSSCSQYTTDTSCNADPSCTYDYVLKKCKSK